MTHRKKEIRAREGGNRRPRLLEQPGFFIGGPRSRTSKVTVRAILP